MDEYKGFSLFNDIEDKELQTRDRAVVLTNMAENHSKNRRININGTGLILGYFKNVPDVDKNDVMREFKLKMAERGFILVNPEKEKEYVAN